MYIHKKYFYLNVCVHEISSQVTSKPLHYQCNLLFCVCSSNSKLYGHENTLKITMKH